MGRKLESPNMTPNTIKYIGSVSGVRPLFSGIPDIVRYMTNTYKYAVL